MKALTIWQPWASLIMAGAKPYEFRTWDFAARFPSFVGRPIVIHAGARAVNHGEVLDLLNRLKKPTAGGTALLRDVAEPILRRILASMTGEQVLPLASGLGTAVLGRARRADAIFSGQVADSDRIDEHVFAWPLRDVTPFPHPIPAKGAQGFWDWPKGLV